MLDLGLLLMNGLGLAITVQITGFLFCLYVAHIVASTFYVAFLGPLRNFPGPPLRKLSNIPLAWEIWRGTEDLSRVKLHAKYGPVMRIAPNSLSYDDARAWKDIYGFRKAGQSAPFKDREFYIKPFNGVDNLFTAGDGGHARQRKMLSHLFADKTLR